MCIRDSIRGGNNGNSIIEFGDTADDDIGKIRYRHNSDSNSMEFITNTEERLRITGDGKVGINVTDPGSIFNVRPLDESNFLIRNEGSIIVLASETNSGRDNNRGMDFEASAYRFIEGGSEKVRIDSSGKVGINSTSPTHELEVLGDSSLKGNVNVTGVSTFTGISTFNNSVGLAHTIFYLDDPDNKLEFSGSDSFSVYIGGSIRFLVRTNSVTVGEDLVISDKLTHNSDTNTMMRFPEDNTITFENNNVGETLRIAGTGNIGIGTTNPTAKLDVNGSLNVTGVSTFSEGLFILSLIHI